MPNQYVNKVQFGDQTIMDITDTSADAQDVLEGEVFYNAAGARTVGALGDATQSAHGLMSAADKQKLDALSTFNANDYEITIESSDWVNNTYTWLNEAVTPSCYVMVNFSDDTSDTFRGNLTYDKVTGGVQFVVDNPPTGDVDLVITIFDSISANGLGEESDPTVPEWAKAATKPTYTAQEVGALPADTVIPTVPTNVSAFTNDAGYITSYTETDPTVPAWAKAAEKPTYTATEVGALPSTTSIPTKTSDLVNDSGYLVQQDISGKADLVDLSSVAISGSYDDLEDTPTIPTSVSQLTNDAGYITGYTETDPTVPAWAKASTKPTYTAAEVGALPDTTVIPTIPTNVSAFTNDSGYLTAHQDISGKANVADLAAVATSGSYNDLSDTPTIPSALSDLTDDVGYLTSYTETDPTVPAWAKESTKPTYTAAEVGATTSSEVGSMIATAIGNINEFDIAVVNELPSANIKTHTIYFVPKTGTANDIYDEYMYINNTWELIGNTQIDLSNYALKSEIPTKVSDLTNDSGYLTSFTESDPTVPAWAKAAAKPTYTTSELTNDAGFITSAAVPTKVSDLTNDAGYLTAHQDISGKANSADLATVATSGSYNDLSNKPSIPAATSDLNNDSGFITSAAIPTDVSDFTNDAGYLTSVANMTGATGSVNGAAGLVPAPTTADAEKFLRGDGTWQDGGRPMVILSYGYSTWDQFIEAYNNNVIVYCRASSNSNPASGNQTRMAFMAYVNSTPPTEVEFQYYRSVSSHTASQMSDQVYIYKLNKSNRWSVTTREAGIKQIVEGANIGVSYASNKVTISATVPTTVSSFTNDAGYLTAHQDISGKVDKVTGKDLSTNDFTDAYKNQLDNLIVATSTEVQAIIDEYEVSV